MHTLIYSHIRCHHDYWSLDQGCDEKPSEVAHRSKMLQESGLVGRVHLAYKKQQENLVYQFLQFNPVIIFKVDKKNACLAM